MGGGGGGGGGRDFLIFCFFLVVAMFKVKVTVNAYSLTSELTQRHKNKEAVPKMSNKD